MASLTGEASEFLPLEERPKTGMEDSVCKIEEVVDGSGSENEHEHEHDCGSYYGGSSDDDIREEYQEYCRQIEESDGFEVDDFRHCDFVGMIVPHRNDEENQTLLTPSVKEALEMFNKDQKTKFEFMRIVNITGIVVEGIKYHITFEAKDPLEAQPRTFQTTVVKWFRKSMEKDLVLFCRLKPPPKKLGIDYKPVHVGEPLSCY